MGYLNAIQTAIGNVGKLGSLGAPPSPKPSPQVGTPPPANPNAAPHPYDAAADPAWKGLLDVADHAFRNFLNGLDPDHREMLRQKLSASATPSPTPPPLFMPPAESRIPPHGVPGVSPPIASTSRTPGTF